jgi:hypothetical protein
MPAFDLDRASSDANYIPFNKTQAMLDNAMLSRIQIIRLMNCFFVFFFENLAEDPFFKSPGGYFTTNNGVRSDETINQRKMIQKIQTYG